MDYIPKMRKVTRKKAARVARHKSLYPSEDAEKLYVGNFVVGTSNTLIPETWDSCYSNINSLDDTDCLVVEFDGTSTASIDLLADAPLVSGIISTKVFTFKLSQEGETVTMHLYFVKLPIPNLNNKAANVVKQVFNVLYQVNDDCITLSSQNNLIENTHELFKNVQRTQNSLSIPKYKVQSLHLAPTLRPYQEKSVSWMIHRERIDPQDDYTHPAYCSIKLPAGTEIFYNKFNGHIEPARPLVKSLKTGGILADEMGLGKTVEILALILYDSTHNSDDSTDVKPMVFKRKRKKPPAEVNNHVEPVQPKKLKVPDDWTKKGKGQTYLLLANWYNNTLVSVNDSRKKPKASHVQCVCGQYENRNDIETCIDCSRMQHKDCMAFESKFMEFRCPQCWKQQPLLKSSATLIVCPASLIDQWCNEICKHVKSGLTILRYEGSCISPVYPLQLLEYDIVIMSYNVLQAELRQAEFSEHKSLRTESKYANPGSPVLLIEWHRLCFDEAQLVEGVAIAEMAQRLTAVHRWAITGTPISKGLSDLYVLIDFLQFDPYSELSTWDTTLYRPYLNGDTELVTEFLSKILWRTQKEDVLDQVNIPPQTSVEHFHDFSEVERFFYDKEHELSCNDFLQKLTKLDMEKPLITLNRSELKKIMAPLLSLRQACIHHNAVKGRYLVTKKTVNSMKELLDALIAKNISECEDNLRLIVSSINGSAGVHILLQNPLQAVVEYRKVLQLSAKFGEDKNNEIKLGVDKLQLIHAMYNLAEILPECPESDKTLRDDTLLRDCSDLEHKFMERYIKETTAIVQSSAKLSSEVMSLEDQLQLKRGQWYAAILDAVDEEDLMNEFRTKLVATLSNNGYKNYNKLETCPKRLFYKINTWDDEICCLREDAIDAVNNLYSIVQDKVFICKELVQAACDCHLRPTKKTKDKRAQCPLCKANTSLRTYESKLFFSVKRVDDVSNEGTWKPSEEEHTLKAIYSLGRSRRMDAIVIKDGDIAIAMLEYFKKEFKEVRKLWRYLDRQICASDEIDMCKIRMTLKVEDEEDKSDKPPNLKNLSYDIVNTHANINQLREHELFYHLTRAQSEEMEHNKMLEKCIGTHKYLQTLHVRQNSGQSPDPCPICKNQLDMKWNILKCGHCYCIECMHMLLGQTTGKVVMCSICREKQSINEINYVEISTAPQDSEDTKVKGNCSTKVENIVRLVMKLKEEDEDVKILIFSNFEVILKVLQDIFNVNGIHSGVLSRSDKQKKLDTFKDSKQKMTVLLLPVKNGSKGLNLIEATHVIFVEPLMDPADELQAVGRVHRIGQTKPTVVHKFIMSYTIEESIFAATSSCSSDWDKNRVTLQQIRKLFFKNT